MAAINNKELNYILTTVIEGGSAYWANDEDVCKECSIERGEDSVVTKITITTDVDDEGWVTKTVTATELRKAMKALKDDEKQPEHWRKKVSKMLNDGDEDYDAYDADYIFQYALFGEVVFG